MTARIVPVLALAALLHAPEPARAQSLLSAAGLGLPAEGLDARSMALGGVAVGLAGPSFVPTDPAAAAWLVVPSATLTAQPSWVDFARGDTDEAGKFRGTTFPGMGMAYPVRGAGVITLTLESFLDQRYEAKRPVTIELLNGPVEATDAFRSAGGVSRVRLGLARAVGSVTVAGVSLGRYGGSVDRTLTRTFEEGVEEGSVVPYQTRGVWRYSGFSVTGGASVSVTSVLLLGGSMTWSSGLNAKASTESGSQERSYDLPIQIRLGASAILAPGLSLVAGFATSNWSGIDDDLVEGASVGRTSSIGGGIELGRASLFGRTAPLRIGYRRTDLPFVLQGGPVRESALSGGVGLALREVSGIVLAAADLALEKGERSDDVINEAFWRATLTLRVSGY